MSLVALLRALRDDHLARHVGGEVDDWHEVRRTRLRGLRALGRLPVGIRRREARDLVRLQRTVPEARVGDRALERTVRARRRIAEAGASGLQRGGQELVAAGSRHVLAVQVDPPARLRGERHGGVLPRAEYGVALHAHVVDLAVTAREAEGETADLVPSGNRVEIPVGTLHDAVVGLRALSHAGRLEPARERLLGAAGRVHVHAARASAGEIVLAGELGEQRAELAGLFAVLRRALHRRVVARELRVGVDHGRRRHLKLLDRLAELREERRALGVASELAQRLHAPVVHLAGVDPALERLLELGLVAGFVAERLLALRHEVAALRLRARVARTSRLQVCRIGGRLLEVLQRGREVLLRHRLLAEADARLHERREQAVRALPHVKAACGEDLVRRGVLPHRVVRVGEAQDAGVVLVHGVAVLQHERETLRRGDVELLRELARLVERAEVAGIGLKRLEVVLVRLAARHARRHARVREVGAGMRLREAEAAERERVARVGGHGLLPRRLRHVLLVHVPEDLAEVVERVGEGLLVVTRLLRRPLQGVQLLQAAREAVVGRHRPGCDERGLPVLAHLRQGVGLEVAEHRVLVAVARGERVGERQRALGGVGLLDGRLRERGVAERGNFRPRANARVVAHALEELLGLEAAVLLGLRERQGGRLRRRAARRGERLLANAPVLERIALEGHLLVVPGELAPVLALVVNCVRMVLQLAVDVRVKRVELRLLHAERKRAVFEDLVRLVVASLQAADADDLVE